MVMSSFISKQIDLHAQIDLTKYSSQIGSCNIDSFDTNNGNKWPQINAEWYYSYNDFWITGYVKIEYSGDTLLSLGKDNKQYYNCQILKKTLYYYNFLNGILDTTHLGYAYTWSTKDTVFVNKHSQLYVLYDFSAQPGDSWIIPETYQTPCDSVGTVQVNSSGDTIINQEMLRYIRVEPHGSSEWGLYGLIIEKYGPIDWYMFPEQNCITDLSEGGPLRCYQDDSCLFSTSIAPYCNYITSINKIAENIFSVYPNPADKWIKISCHANNLFNMSIWNSIGNIVYKSSEIENGSIIKIEKLPPGLYFLSFSCEKQHSLNFKLTILKL